MNTELFKKIHEQISSNPGGFDMDDWELDGYENGCGTTRCVAGWAAYLTTGKPLYTGCIMSPATRALAYSLDVVPEMEDIGAKLLGLERDDKCLFYTSGERALEFVELAAAGDDEGARRVLHDE